MSPTFRRQHQVVTNITLAVGIHDTVSRLKKNKNFYKEIQIDASKSLFDWPRVSVNQFWASICNRVISGFLTVKSVGPDTNEQHSSFRASAEHISHSRSDLSENYDEKNFRKFEKSVKTFIWDYFVFTSIISDQIRSTFVAYFWWTVVFEFRT